MRDNRKEIIRDLLGDFADEGEEQEQYPVSDDEDETVKRKVKKVISDSDEDDAFQLDKIIEKPSRKKNKKIKKVSDVMKAEIIEEGLIPNYNVAIPSFSTKERQLFNEIREKLVEVAVTQDDFKVDEESFIAECKQFLRAKGVRDVDRLS
ncbi:MAG TPA: CpaF family protein, partial [Methanobacterium sp.]|nr:CpaF family protein [Methanobacterium sp.]